MTMSKKRNKNTRKKQIKSRILPKHNVSSVKRTNVLASLDYKITQNAVDDDDIRALPNEIQNKIEDLYERVQVSPQNTIKELLVLIKAYPHIPQLYNYLHIAYSYTGQNKKSYKIMKDNYEQNPSYLFAKLNYSDYLVKQGEFDKVPEIYDYKFNLTELYPNRDTFHETEVISFNGVIGYYYAMIGEYDNAKHCLNMLKALSKIHMYTLRLEEKLKNGSQLIA
jgi:tetratricopeptide (TPR) repeat protein